jgi:hypothetical protein
MLARVLRSEECACDRCSSANSPSRSVSRTAGLSGRSPARLGMAVLDSDQDRRYSGRGCNPPHRLSDSRRWPSAQGTNCCCSVLSRRDCPNAGHAKERALKGVLQPIPALPFFSGCNHARPTGIQLCAAKRSDNSHARKGRGIPAPPAKEPTLLQRKSDRITELSDPMSLIRNSTSPSNHRSRANSPASVSVIL